MSSSFGIDDISIITFAGEEAASREITSNLDGIETWGTPHMFKGKLSMILLHQYNDRMMLTVNSKFADDSLGGRGPDIQEELKRIVVDAVIDFETRRNFIPKILILADDFTPLFYAKEKNQKFYLDIDESDLKNYNFEPITISALKSLIDSCNTTALVWCVGNVVMKNFISWPSNILGALVLDAYCDKAIPLSSVRGKVLTEITRDGFGFLVSYLWRFLYPDKSLNHDQISLIYEQFRKSTGGSKNALPHIPLTWNDEDIEGINITRIKRDIEVFTSNKGKNVDIGTSKEIVKVHNPVFDNEELNTALDMINDGLRKSMKKSITKDTGRPSYNLSEIVSQSATENQIYLNDETYNQVHDVKIDCDIEVSSCILLKQNIAVGQLVYGVLEIIVPAGIIAEEERENIEKQLGESKGIPLIIFEEKDTESIAKHFAEILEEQEEE
jgi:hypothetical protein